VDPAKPCTGNIRVFDNVTNCDGNGATTGSDSKKTVPANGTCQDTMSNFDSLYYVPDQAAATTCMPSAPTAGMGTAPLTALKTVCCSP